MPSTASPKRRSFKRINKNSVIENFSLVNDKPADIFLDGKIREWRLETKAERPKTKAAGQALNMAHRRNKLHFQLPLFKERAGGEVTYYLIL